MRRLLIVLAFVGLVLVPGAHAVSARQAHAAPTIRYVVQPGDNLWKIAGAQHLVGDRREAVYRVMQLNHLNSAIVIPGQTLRIPAH